MKSRPAGRSTGMPAKGSSDDLVLRLEGKPIHKVLPGSILTPEGIAVWFLDQMATKLPRTQSITIWQDEEHGYEVSRDIRF